MILALLIATLLLPASTGAGGRVECPACHHRSGVDVGHRHYEDPTYVAFRDDCDFLHFHDASYDEVTYECRRCRYRWSVEIDTAPPCWCGWKRGDSNYHDPCTPLEAPDDASP